MNFVFYDNFMNGMTWEKSYAIIFF